MQLCRLDLTAFGPFTDHLLDFENSEAKLHIVYGANEAGKSSALRGLKALLYGIPARTTDNFIHSHQQMRVGGCLRSQHGEEIDFVRRKGRKDTLLSVEGTPLDPMALKRYLQGVSADFFESLFGIDHGALVRGGEEILDQKGEVGQALFSAALGSRMLHQLLDELDAEADALFRPRGSTQQISTAVKAYKELQRKIRDTSLSSAEWKGKCSDFEGVVSRLGDVSITISAAISELNRQRRIRRVQPKLARRNEQLLQLTALGDVVVLSDDFTKRRRQATGKLETAQELNQKTENNYNELQEEFKVISVNKVLLDLGETIAELHQRVGAHRKAMQDRPDLRVRCSQLLSDANKQLQEIRPDLELDKAEQLRPVYARRHRIAGLGVSQQQLIAALKSVEKGRHENKTALQECREQRQQLAEAGSADALRSAINIAKREGDLEHALHSGRKELEMLEQQGVAGLAQLALWEGGLHDLALLPLPTHESINRFEESYQRVVGQLQRLTEKQEEWREYRYAADRQIGEVQGAGDVPSEELLDESRNLRDQLWSLLRRRWVDDENIDSGLRELDAGSPLHDQFEQHIAEADEISDRLRREADRVQQLAALAARQQEVESRSARIAQQLLDSTDERQQIEQRWQLLWQPCGIEPLPPREMREWLGRVEILQELLNKIKEKKRKNKEIKEKLKKNIKSVGVELAALDKTPAETMSFDRLLAFAGDVITAIDQLAERRQMLLEDETRLKQKLRSLDSDKHQQECELDAWRSQWKEAVEGLDLTFGVSPSEANALIEKCGELFSKLAEADVLQQRIDGIDRDAANFRKQVEQVVEQVSEDLSELAEEDAVVRLNALLTGNRERQSRREALDKQLHKLHRDMQSSAEMIRSMQDRLQVLCVEAQCSAPSELEAAERSSESYLQLKKELLAMEQQILEAGEGASLVDLEHEAQHADVDSLPAEIAVLESSIEEELQPQQRELAEEKGRLQKELELMDGSDAVALLAEESQLLLADIRSHAEQYVRVKFAARILRDQIEEYRKQNQGPLIKRASEHFAALTGSSFASLQTDFNSRDEPVLVGIRPDDARVHVEGMSAGTRDQLYLALRLASLEKYIESAGPMPFIVDDILVDFDDQRSKAALERLSQLSRTTQVILFT
ncbi:MAG: AAA family ATPase, partial [Pseudomonadota bacterium]|nr:AAA family ATPase [Pseudomonadota bacterium]